MKNTLTAFILLFMLSKVSYSQIQFVSDCNDIIEVNELSTLDGFFDTMLSPTGEVVNFDFCNNAGDIDNPNWLAFTVDPYFKYSFTVIFDDCNSSLSSQSGGQIAIYESCDLSSDAFFCYSAPGNGPIEIVIDEEFIANQIYYILIDGYAASVCDVEITVERYLPMESITDWYHTVGGFLGTSTYWYRDVGDTIINGLEYRTIDVYPEPDFPYNRYLREVVSTKKVYSYNSFNDQEVLLYDFAASIGDNIEIANTGTFTVIAIDEVESAYGNLRRWELDGPGPSIFVIEGIGSADLFLANTASDPVYGLLCAYNKNDKIFGNDNCNSPPRWTPINTSIFASICEGESYEFNEEFYESNGVYMDTLTNVEGIDSIITLELTVLSISEIFVGYTLCDGESISIGETVFDIINPMGTVILFNASANGCDSIINIDLIFMASSIDIVEVALCEGEVYEFNGIIFDEESPSGNIFLAGAAANGCDSIINVDLSFFPVSLNEIQATICEGDSIIFGNQILFYSGLYTDLFASSNGCDSIVNLSLEVVPETNTVWSESICNGEIFILNDIQATESGQYQSTLESSNGCDSLITINLEVLPSIFVLELFDLCPGDSIVIANQSDPDITIFEGGNFIFHYFTTEGCDSTVQVEVTELPESECLTSTYDLQNFTIDISPNPFDHSIYLSSQEIIESIDVVNISGTKVDRIDNISSYEYSYRADQLVSGIYILTVRSEDKIAIKKIVKY